MIKALILNSGLGSRLGDLTEHSPKALMRLGNGESIFERQIRLLLQSGIKDFVITTGPFPGMLEEVAEQFQPFGATFTFVNNPDYAKTNYIYSMYLAEKYLMDADTILILHGDLVFDRLFVSDLLAERDASVAPVVKTEQLGKDFKASLDGDRVLEISVSLRGECYAFQPFYKLDATFLISWMDSIRGFIEEGRSSLYAEEALNPLLAELYLKGFDCESHYISEIDDKDDLKRVSASILDRDRTDQLVFLRGNSRQSELISGLFGSVESGRDIVSIYERLGIHRPLVVISSHLDEEVARDYLPSSLDASYFNDYSSNPSVEDVQRALEGYLTAECDSLISIGGGSAIDVAKCVKSYAAAQREDKYCVDAIPHVAIPTTAGTGSESTHFAVCYDQGEKVSVAQEWLLPEVAFLDSRFLRTLPQYHKGCALLDALCQAIESVWARGSNEVSQRYALQAIRIITSRYSDYLSGDMESAEIMIVGANLAGRAINISKTTAAHAMSYQLTSLFGIPHGAAVALCMPGVWKKTLLRINDLNQRDSAALQEKLYLINEALCGSCDGGVDAGLICFEDICKGILENTCNPVIDDEALRFLVESVNGERLSNHPVDLRRHDIELIYKDICAISPNLRYEARS